MNGAVPLPLPKPAEAAPRPAIPRANSATDRGSLGGYALLFLPFGVAWVLSPVPLLSYLAAWAGSVWILWLSMGGHVRPLPEGVQAFDQLLRPIVLTQILFASYSFLTSVFFVADLYGFYYFERASLSVVNPTDVAVAAQAQRYYVLAHAGVVAGMLLAMDYRRSGEWVVRQVDNPALALVAIAVVTYFLGNALGLANQIGARVVQFSLVGSALGLTLAVVQRRWVLASVGGGVFGLHLAAAFLSGWKEDVLMTALLLAVFLYPYARRLVLVGAPVLFVLLLTVLPTYVNVVRSLSWSGETSAEEAASAAAEEVRTADMGETNWAFLTDRVSEIGLFVRYIDRLGTTGPFYEGEILGQAAMGLVPRALWDEKPNMEAVVMERVLGLGIVQDYSSVSAKPQYVVDGYLSFGGWGILGAGLVFGLLASWASRASERWFGGYLWGSGLVFASMFSIFWKGNCFEFFFANVFWSFVLLVPLFWLGRATGFIVRSEPESDELDMDPERVESSPDRPRMRRHW